MVKDVFLITVGTLGKREIAGYAENIWDAQQICVQYTKSSDSHA